MDTLRAYGMIHVSLRRSQHDTLLATELWICIASTK